MIRPGHPLYPLVVLYALPGLLLGAVRRRAGDDSPESKTHPYFPDHFWPYLVLVTAVLITLGLLAWLGQPVLQVGQAADPRSGINPRPEWYFLALFQFAKLGPGLFTKMLVPALLAVGLIFWPLVDSGLGPRIAHRLGWSAWPAPKRNPITATIWVAGLVVVGLLTVWPAFSPQLCLPWPYYGPVCGG